MKLEPPPFKEIKQEAKKIKAFLVLIKKKLTRDQVPRSRLFRLLMALVFDPDLKDRV